MTRRYAGIFLLFLFSALSLRAQLSGTKNIPGDYTSLAAAVADLNTQGVGPGGVVINLLAGNPQTAPAGGYSITATGTATDPVTFQGNNNTITASGSLSVGSANDAIFKIIGGDYISILAFTMRENNFNTNTTPFSNNMTEWGVALLYASTTDGAQYNLISGCNIALNRAYVNTWGIYSNTRHNYFITAGDITSFSGSNSYNRIYSNTISNVCYGVAFIGSNVAAYQDAGNEIGGSSSGTGNTFTNWGGIGASSMYTSNTSAGYCIYMNHQVSDRVAYNTMTSALFSYSSLLTGIFKNYSAGTPAGTFTSTISNNNITLSHNGTTGWIEHVRSEGITSLPTATLNITNNTIANSVITGSSTGSNHLQGITNISAVGILNITGNILRNCTMNTSTGTYWGIFNGGAVTNTINISNNQIGNSGGGALTSTSSTSGSLYPISNSGAASSATININSNSLQGFSLVTVTSFTAILNSGNSTTAININSNSLGTSSGNLVSFSGAQNFDVRGIHNTGGTSACVLSIQSNNIRGIVHTVAGTAFARHSYIMNQASTLSQTISNNLFTNLNVNTAGDVDFINNQATLSATAIATINNNAIVTGFSKTSPGGTVRFYLGNVGSASSGSAINLLNNNFSNVTVTGATIVEGMADYYSGAPAKTVTGNIFNSWNCGTGSVTALYIVLYGPSNLVSGNTISNINNSTSIKAIECITGTSGTTDITGNTIFSLNSLSSGNNVTGISCNGNNSGISVLNISNNLLHSFSSVSVNFSVTGISVTTGATSNIFRNKIYNLQESGTNGSANGILLAGGTSNTVYNNIIGDLRAPASNASNAIIGINITGGTGNNIYFNTIYLSGTSTGSNFGSSGISVNTTSSVDLRNNLVVNLSTPNGTGLTVAYRRSGTVLTTYSNSSNNNSYYAGIPGPSRLIFYDGTNSDQTLISYQTRVAPRDNASLTINPVFSSTTGSSLVFLHIPAATASLLESGGMTIAGISNDYDNDVRPGPVGSVNGGATAPDIGADEFDGIPVNCASSPVITVSPSSTTSCYPGPGTTLTASGSAVSYAWMPSISLSSQSGTSVTASPSVVTTYTVTGYYTNGCTSTANTTVNIIPSPTVTATASPSSFCNGGTSSLTASGASSYVWMPGSFSGPSISVSPTATTTYTVTGTAANGCTNTTNVMVTVNPLPTVTASAGSSSVCLGSSTTLNGSGASSYLWMPGSISGASIAVSPTSTTTYTVTGTDANGCSNAATVTVTVNPLPTVTATAGSSTICAGGATTLTGSGSSSYLWMPGSMSGTSISVSPTSTTTYTVTGTDANGCSNAASATVTVNPLPAVNATASQSTLCSGGSASLTGSGASSYLWMPGSLSGTTVSVSPGSTTIYTVTGTDGNGCTNTANVTVTVNPLPNINASASSSSICLGGSATLNSSGASSYLWMPGSISGASISVSPAGTTTYTVTGTDGNGCSNTASVTVTVNPLPSVNATAGSSSICAGGSTTLTGSGAASYMWMPGSLSGTSVSVSPISTTTYTLTGTDGNGCTNTASVTVTVNPLPTVIATASSSFICTGSSTSLTGSGATSYLWMPGSQSSTSISVSPATTTTYTLTGTDANGCSNSNTLTITVNPLPVVNANASAVSICQGDMVVFSGSGTASSFNWSGGVTDAVPFSVISSGSYTVTGTDANGCSDTASIFITVNSIPVVTLGNDTAMCGGIILLDAGNPGATYLWNDNSTGQTLIVNSSGTYYVTVTQNGQCSSTDTIDITIHALPAVTFSMTMDTICSNHGQLNLSATPAGGIFSGPGVTGNAFDPQALIGTQVITYNYTDPNGCQSSANDSIWVDICNGVLAENNPLPDAVIFPNPNDGAFTIMLNYTPGSILTIQIMNELGQITETLSTASRSSQLNLQQYARGIYTIRLIDGENIFVKQIVIQ